MAIRQSSTSTYVAFTFGVDDTTVVGSPQTVGTLSRAYNTDLIDDSILSKRRGYTPVNTSQWGTRRVRAGLDYIPTTGTAQHLIYGEDGFVTGSSGELAKLSGTSTPISVKSGLKDSVKPSIIQFKDLCYFFNGQDDFIYDGSTTRQIGITPPTTAPTENSNISGQLAANLDYLGAYTYYNSTTGAESSPSPISEPVNSSALGGILWNIVPGDSSTADKIRFYRTVAAGDTLFLDGEVGISSTVFASSTPDDALTTQLELDNSRPEKATYATTLENRIFLAGTLTNPNRVHYSKIGIAGPMPESFQADDFADCNINDGDRIVGLGSVNNSIIVVKERSVGRLTRIEIPTGGLELSGSTKYIYEEISKETTAINHDSLVQLDNILLWLGRDDIYGTDGLKLYRFGKRIRNTIKNLNFTHSWKFSSINKKNSQQVIFSVVSPGYTEPDFQLVGHYRNLPEIAWTFYTPGPNKITHPGLPAGALFALTTGQTVNYYFGSSSAAGTVYQFDTGNNDNSSGIYWDIRLPWESHNSAASKKLFHSFYAFLLGDGNDYSVTHTFEEDNEEAVVKTHTNSLLNSDNYFWDQPTWDNFYWASLKFLLKRFHPHKKAYFGRYGIQNINANEPVFVKGIQTIVQMYPITR